LSFKLVVVVIQRQFDGLACCDDAGAVYPADATSFVLSLEMSMAKF
jgi:hypothetical protein